MDGDAHRRVYGADHDDPAPGPQPGRQYVELLHGPLDGLLLDVTSITGEPRAAAGAYLIVPHSAERADYEPLPDDPAGPWVWRGNVP